MISLTRVCVTVMQFLCVHIPLLHTGENITDFGLEMSSTFISILLPDLSITASDISEIQPMKSVYFV